MDDVLSRIEDASITAGHHAKPPMIDGWLVRFAPSQATRSRCNASWRTIESDELAHRWLKRPKTHASWHSSMQADA